LSLPRSADAAKLSFRGQTAAVIIISSRALSWATFGNEKESAENAPKKRRESAEKALKNGGFFHMKWGKFH
jgi:hypothetical protein